MAAPVWTPDPYPRAAPSRWRKTLVNSGVLAAGGCLALAALLFVFPLTHMEERGVFGDPVAFDSAEWKRNADYPFVIPIRSRMAGDLVRRRLLIGKTTREVEELLGPPDWRNEKPSIDLGYTLRIAVSDSESLLIDTENDVVEDVRGTW